CASGPCRSRAPLRRNSVYWWPANWKPSTSNRSGACPRLPTRSPRETVMQISVGYELIYRFPQPTPMILAVNIHPSRVADIVIPDILTVDPPVPVIGYHDGFGNWCTRIVAPAGQVRIASRGLVNDSGAVDDVAPHAPQHTIQDLPEETLVFLLGSR